jgi:regulator of protease activity HflC (stomatin/prohibitin superfamily)
MQAQAYVVIIAGLIVLYVLLVIARTIRVVQPGHVGVVKRLGQYLSTRNPGTTFLFPVIDRMEMVDMRETSRTGDRQDVITRDNVSTQVNATIFSQVVDPRSALFGVSNYRVAIDQLTRSVLRAEFGELTLDDALSQREQISARLRSRMETETDRWGVRINRVEIIDILPLAGTDPRRPSGRGG